LWLVKSNHQAGMYTMRAKVCWIIFVGRGSCGERERTISRDIRRSERVGFRVCLRIGESLWVVALATT
jgi:hypothetical protein